MRGGSIRLESLTYTHENAQGVAFLCAIGRASGFLTMAAQCMLVSDIGIAFANRSASRS